MSAPLPTTATRLEEDFELRWSRWLANGARQDAVLQRRAITAAVLASCGLIASLLVTIYLR